MIFLIGIAELVTGVGIYNLKNNLKQRVQIVGILKIINGTLLITIILAGFALFLIVPILIVEILLLYSINMVSKPIHDGKAHFLK